MHRRSISQGFLWDKMALFGMGSNAASTGQGAGRSSKGRSLIDPNGGTVVKFPEQKLVKVKANPKTLTVQLVKEKPAKVKAEKPKKEKIVKVKGVPQNLKPGQRLEEKDGYWLGLSTGTATWFYYSDTAATG